MSGHSHAKTIAHAKGIADAKRGKIFSKFGRLISIAAREGGGDPIMNSKLRVVIEQAKGFNMPKENIERAIKRGTGELAGDNLEEVSYEGFGPGGIALIIDGITDNSNRTLSEIKVILNQNGSKMAGEGAVRWMFEKKGVILIPQEGKTKEELEEMAIELGADDVKWSNNMLEIYTNPEDFEIMRKALEVKQIKMDSAALEYLAKEEVEVSGKEKEAAERLFEALDDNDAVNDVYSNMKD